MKVNLMPVIKISNESFRAVPVFPLQGLHLFPQTILPLRIFEPRYLEMLEYVLEHEHLLAVADVDPAQNHQAKSRLRPVLGAGIVMDMKSQSDGSKVIFLQGITRLNFIEERPQIHSFRQVHAEILFDEKTAAEPLTHVDYKIRSLLLHVAQGHSAMQDMLHDILELSNTPEILSNVLSAKIEILSNMLNSNLVIDVALKRYLFEEINPRLRLESIYDELADLCVESLENKKGVIIH